MPRQVHDSRRYSPSPIGKSPSFSTLPAPGPNVGLFPSDFSKKDRNGLWYAWLGVGISFSMLVFDFSPYLALCTGLIFIALWIRRNVDQAKLLWEFLHFLTDIFFREIGCRGEHMLPTLGPAILVCGPHSNQFVDALVVSSVCKRQDICYVIANATLRRKFVGILSQAMAPIGIERANDVAVEGSGVIQVRGAELQGTRTSFTSKDVGSLCTIEGIGRSTIVEVKSSTSVILSNSIGGAEWSATATYKLAPSINSKEFYEDACQRLREGKIVAIFPEGGSHDRTKMLDLKPGFALLALMATYKLQNPIPIVPVGLTYFQGHRFRSRAFLDFGAPMRVTPEQIDNYVSSEEGKRSEVSNIMKQTKRALECLTVQTDSYQDLQLFWALRRLYTTERLTAEEKQSLNRCFVEGYEKVKHLQRVKDLVIAVRMYTTKLKQCGLHDYMVAHRLGSLTNIKESTQLYSLLLWTFVGRILLLCFACLCWIPSGIVALPFVLTVRVYSRKKAREACKKSTVKITGRDVLASWKILISMALIPFLHGFYTLVVLYFFDHRWATMYFFFMPAISVMNFKTAENIVRIARSLRPLFIFIRGKDEAKCLVEMRTLCAREVTECADNLGWLECDPSEEEVSE